MVSPPRMDPRLMGGYGTPVQGFYGAPQGFYPGPPVNLAGGYSAAWVSR